MQSVLVPIDGSEYSLRAVKAAAKAAKISSATLYILNVQPPIMSGNVKRFISADIIDQYHQEEGRKALAAAISWLDEAGMPYTSEIKVGHTAQVIAEFIKDHRCDRIFMGTRGLGAVTGLLLGSITTKTLSLVDIPVTLVK